MLDNYAKSSRETATRNVTSRSLIQFRNIRQWECRQSETRALAPCSLSAD